MDLQLSGKRAQVTGTNAGIGLAIAEALSREGAHVIITGRKREAVIAVVDRLGSKTGTEVRGLTTVNSGLPGPTRSQGVENFVEALAENEGKTFEAFETEFLEKVRPTSLLKRFATPAEVASLVAYVASPLASATTGAALRADGGVVKSTF